MFPHVRPFVLSKLNRCMSFVVCNRPIHIKLFLKYSYVFQKKCRRDHDFVDCSENMCHIWHKFFNLWLSQCHSAHTLFITIIITPNNWTTELTFVKHELLFLSTRVAEKNLRFCIVFSGLFVHLVVSLCQRYYQSFFFWLIHW